MEKFNVYFSKDAILFMSYTYQAVTMLCTISAELMHFIPINNGQLYTVLCRNRSEREQAERNRLNSTFKENMLLYRVNLYLPVVLSHSFTGREVRSLNRGGWRDVLHPFITALGHPNFCRRGTRAVYQG